MKESTFVLDVNVWVSFVLGKQMEWLSQIVKTKKIEILSSDELYSELSEVLNRPKFKKHISISVIEESLAIHLKLTRKVNDTLVLPYFADSDDDYLMALALKGKAAYIVTGDKLILNTPITNSISIISLAFFKNKVS
jgi:putative PIN family toxin of toxin-antitoxin system